MTPLSARAYLRSAGALLLCLLTSSSAAVRAQDEGDDGDEIFESKGLYEARSYVSHLPFVRVDTLTGNLMLDFTDLHLPGNGGFDIDIQRSYNSKAGGGWLVGIAGVPFRVNDGGSREAILPGFRTPDGASHRSIEEVQYQRSQVITREFWKYNRTDGTLRMPNGWICEYNYEIGEPGELGYTRYLTRITDPFGNTVDLEWSNQVKPRLDRIVQDLRNTQTREVTFVYDDVTGTLDAMYFEGRTWTCEYTTEGTGGGPMLSSRGSWAVAGAVFDAPRLSRFLRIQHG